MIFSSYSFVFVFLPVVVILYYTFSKFKSTYYQRFILIVASLFFYGFNNPSYLILFVISVIMNYVLALGIQNSGIYVCKKMILMAGVLSNLGLIGYFKYYNFFISNVNFFLKTDFGLREILLPLGISFFTFQQLTFLISVYRQEERTGGFIEYCLFVSFFPQLVAGPIVIYNEMEPQFVKDKNRFFNIDNFTAGIYLFVIGIFKKAVIADTISVFVDNGFKISNIGFAAALVTSISYTLQIFFDFSGYSDMAVGIGKMFNYDLPFNFSSPYKAGSITEFWRRWHITLGRALTRCVYIPLGGNRKGIKRTCINLFLVFLVSGVWHGADWTFAIWGMCHGILVVVERVFKKQFLCIPSGIRTVITFLCINFLWVLFRAENLVGALVVYKGLIGLSGMRFEQISQIAKDGIVNFPDFINYIYVMGILLLTLIITFKCQNSIDRMHNFIRTRRNALCVAFLFWISVICMSRESIFIYFIF